MKSYWNNCVRTFFISFVTTLKFLDTERKVNCTKRDTNGIRKLETKSAFIVEKGKWKIISSAYNFHSKLPCKNESQEKMEWQIKQQNESYFYYCQSTFISPSFFTQLATFLEFLTIATSRVSSTYYYFHHRCYNKVQGRKYEKRVRKWR